MADVIRKSTNKFSKGLVMDFSPENTNNEVLTSALNATLLTFNGNELSLQNDMGNARVETAYLPAGYMPVGTCEYGGIIYIVSYNPLENKSQIGCFPSPERNITREELGELNNTLISKNNFQVEENGNLTGEIKNNTQYVLLKNSNLNPGDKFIITAKNDAEESITEEKLADLWENKDNEFILKEHPIIALNVVSIEDSGKIVYLNSTTRQYEFNNHKYHILEKNCDYSQHINIDEYRNVLSSGYSVFKSKTSGKLAILAELIMIDSYSVTHRLIPKENDGEFDIVISTEISPELSKENYFIEPKLRFYYLKNSQGYLQRFDGNVKLFNNNKINSEFTRTTLDNIYTPIDENIKLSSSLGDSGRFNFPYANTYHANIKPYSPENLPEDMTGIYTKFTPSYSRIQKSQIEDNIGYYKSTVNAKFYYYNNKGEQYTEYTNSTVNTSYTYFIKSEDSVYTDAKRDTSNKNKELWKIQSIKQIATEKEKKDTTIEKWFEEIVYGYVLATEEQIAQGTGLFIKTDDNKYKTVGEVKEGETYYVRMDGEPTLVSLGKTNQENNNNTLYYYPENSEIHVKAEEEDLIKYWDFDSYPLDTKAPWGCPITLYVMEKHDKWVPITHEEVTKYQNLNQKIYYDTRYVWISDISNYDSDDYQLFMVVPEEIYIDSKKFKPSEEYNYISGVTTQAELNNPEGDPDAYPDENPVSLYIISEFIPSNVEGQQNYLSYDDIILANIKIPEVIVTNELDLPFKYDYTIVPCMNYGKLGHLAVSNTVDFSKLRAFDQSNFTTWKYYVDENQLRLTFGANIYDTYETDKVDGLILEFYDCWGFAGSLEIIDKKSYSGIFTKTIPFNTLNALSTNKINSNELYIRNINISKDKDIHYFEGKKVIWNTDTGWIYEEGKDSIPNDCGTLYPNIIYGVKTYLRKTDNKGNKTYIPKKELFLFTLPIYNEYYNNIDDFSTLTNPELQLVLTYKLEDSSIKKDYTDNNTVQNGYDNKSIIDEYLGGQYNKNEPIDAIKYYQYEGISKLYLEVGLKKEYESLNMYCDSAINKDFKCKIQLIGDENGKIFTVNSDKETNDILNYKENIAESINSLGFTSSYDNIKEITNLAELNFINPKENPSPIEIHYKFVVGYTINIDNIRTTQVPATTVCALCHKDTEGNYNYEDFGIYEQTIGETSYLLSNMMFYNGGDSTTEIFGLCRQIRPTGTAAEQCQSITSVSKEAEKQITPGKLNSGDSLKNLISNIGKLTFCQPHAHILLDGYGVNIYHSDTDQDAVNLISDPSYYTVASEKCRQQGTIPTSLMFNIPKYNLSLNTQNSVKYNSEFLSTLEYGTKTGNEYESPTLPGGPKEMRIFSGFTGEQVAKFNKCMIETMKNVYAYNPDYDQITVNKGDVTLQDYNPRFESNLLSTNAQISGELNDYVYLLSSILVKDYLSSLNKYSNINITEQVRFIPDYTYCGQENNPYLISNLTYNTPVPPELEEELEFTTSDTTIIKKSDGNVFQLKGLPDKKALYGLNKHNKMVQLDVSNYKIDDDGVLSTLDYVIDDRKDFQLNIIPDIIKSLNENFKYNFNTYFNDEELNLSLSFEANQSHNCSSSIKYCSQSSEDNCILAFFTYNGNDSSDPAFYFSSIITVSEGYNIIVNEFVNNISYKILCGYDINNNNIPYEKQQIDVLNKLLEANGDERITIQLDDGLFLTEPVDYFRVKNSGEYVSANISSDLHSQNKTYIFKPQGHPDHFKLTLLVKIQLKNIDYTINKITVLWDTEQSFIPSYRTKNYSEINYNKYRVSPKYKEAILKGGYITINDLIYEPNQEGHRLFMRNNLCTYDPTLRGKIYYRSLDGTESTDWNYNNTKDLNTLYIFTGPCFTTYNLST